MGRLESRKYKGYWITILDRGYCKGDIDYSLYIASIEDDKCTQLFETQEYSSPERAEEMAEYLIDIGIMEE